MTRISTGNRTAVPGSAEPALFEFDRQIPDQEEVKALVGALYGCMLNIARLLRPRTDPTTAEWKQKMEERLNWIEGEVIKNRVWLTAAVFTIAQTLINEMRLAVAAEPDESKVRALQEIIYQKTNIGANLVGIVVANVGRSCTGYGHHSRIGL